MFNFCTTVVPGINLKEMIKNKIRFTGFQVPVNQSKLLYTTSCILPGIAPVLNNMVAPLGRVTDRNSTILNCSFLETNNDLKLSAE
jgi:hypothetical protein